MSSPVSRSQEEEEERKHFQKVVNAFRTYRRDTKERLGRTVANLKRLPMPQRRLLRDAGFEDGLNSVETCAEINYQLVRSILQGIGTRLFMNDDALVGRMNAGDAGSSAADGEIGDDPKTLSLPRTDR